MYTTASLRALGATINEFRVIEPDFPASYAAILLYVARHEKEQGEWPNLADISSATGMIRPSVSRAVQTLSDRRLGKSKPGEARSENARKSLKLVERVPDEVDLRMIRVRLTDKGRGLIQRLADHIA